MKLVDKNFLQNINFHDCKIVGIIQTGQSLSILIDNSGGFTDIEEIKFENYKIIKQDTSLINSWWLVNEIYITDGKYELQVLLDNESRELIEFHITAENISFKNNKEK